MAIPVRPAAGGVVESAWGGIVHDTVVARDFQYGDLTVTIAAGQFQGTLTWTYARPFASPPTVLATLGNAGATHIVAVSSVGATSALLTVRQRADVVSAGGYIVQVLAIGPRV